MDKALIEQLWLKVFKIRWPNLVIGSEDYNHRRKAFFMGCMTILTIISKVPDSALPIIINRCADELKNELGRNDENLLQQIKLN